MFAKLFHKKNHEMVIYWRCLKRNKVNNLETESVLRRRKNSFLSLASKISANDLIDGQTRYLLDE